MEIPMSETTVSSPILLQLGSEKTRASRSLWADAWRRLKRNQLAMFGLYVIVIFLLLSFIGPLFSPYDYFSTDLTVAKQGPSAQHWMGTDTIGRDVLTRILYGGRTALLVGLMVVGLSTGMGVILGGISAYAGGTVDTVIMRIADIFMAFPALLLAIFIDATVKKPAAESLYQLYEQTGYAIFSNRVALDYLIVFGALALASWPYPGRLVRGQVLSIREENYVLAARAVGAKPWHILRRHVIPNSLSPLIVSMSAGFGGAMLAEASLSYLGLGIQPPGASWGQMISDAQVTWRQFPHLILMPGLVLSIVVFAANMLGDGLNDALNVRQWSS
jgi:peptide/nickel transport system permease protein